MDIGVFLTDGSGNNNFRNIVIFCCNTGVQFGSDDGYSCWANANWFYGSKDNDNVNCGVRFINGHANVLNGMDITGNGTGSPNYGGVSFEGYMASGNSIIGCFLESNSPDVHIASLNNKIIDCCFCSATSFGWESGYDGAGSGNVIFGNRFVNAPSNQTEVVLSNLGIGTPSPDCKLSVVDTSNETQAIFGDGIMSGTSQILIGLSGGTTDALLVGFNHDSEYGFMKVRGTSGGIVVANNGNVGIGSTAPASKLQVSGGDIELGDLAKGVIYNVNNSTVGALNNTDGRKRLRIIRKTSAPTSRSIQFGSTNFWLDLEDA